MMAEGAGATDGGAAGGGVDVRRVFVCSARWSREFVEESIPADWQRPALVVRLPHPSKENAEECAHLVRQLFDSAGGVQSDAGSLVVHNVSDDPMVVLGLMRERALASGDNAVVDLLQNYPLRPTLVAANKLLTRLSVGGECAGIPFAGVFRSDTAVPSVGSGVDQVILKPLAGCGSVGISVTTPGASLPDSFSEGTEDDLVFELCQQHFPGNVGEGGTGNAIGIAEAYMPPESTHKCSADGYVCANGKTVVLTIGRNVYAEEEPERLTHCQYPSELDPAVESAIADKMHRILAALHTELGVHNQVIDVEFFVTENATSEGDTRVEVMEINGRAFANFLPLFPSVIGHSIFAIEDTIRKVRGDTPLDDFPYPTPEHARQCGVVAWVDFMLPEGVYRDPEFPAAFVISTGDNGVTHAYGLDGLSVDAALAQARGLAESLRSQQTENGLN